jgi:hypothetical protein
MRADQAEHLAIQVPELVLRDEPAHREAFIHLGPGPHTEPAQWQLITQSLHSWAQEHAIQPSELGARMTYLADATSESESQGPTATSRSQSPDPAGPRGSTLV